MSGFESPDLPEAPKFTSISSLDAKSLGADPSRIHLVWSLSKDFAASGVRLVRAKNAFVDKSDLMRDVS